MKSEAKKPRFSFTDYSLPQQANGQMSPVAITAIPEPRTDEYYRKRPCVRMTETATCIFMYYQGEKYET